MDFEGTHVNTTIHMHQCEFARNSKVDSAPKSSSDEDDFEEDDEEESEGKARKLKFSNY
jgi:hypothetical protein